MTDEYILSKGYKQYPPSVIDHPQIVAGFQKRFDDDFGKKYFINIKKWSNNYIPMSHRGEHWNPYSYEYEVYVTKFKEEKPMTINFYSSWTLEEVESFVESFFKKMKPNYYENWDYQKDVKEV